MNREDELAEIAKFISERGVTRCPTVMCAAVTGLEHPADVPPPPRLTAQQRRERMYLFMTGRAPAAGP